MSDELIRALRDAAAYLRWLKRSGLVPLRMAEQGAGAPVSAMAAPPPAKRPAAAAAPSPGPGGTVQAKGPRGLVMQFAGEGAKVRELNDLSGTVSACRKCALGNTRTNAVFGVGNPDADLVFIGEAPGATEDETGKPFVGNAGNLLTKELAKHGIGRDEVFICNILKCRPPGNRDPLPDEIAACEPHLLRQLDILKPKMLCGLGRYAVATLLRQEIRIMQIRGTWRSYHDIPLFVCLHPAAVLHQPNNRDLFVNDIAALAKAYHERGKG